MPFSPLAHTRISRSVTAFVSLLGLFSLAASTSAQVSTSTTLSVTNTSGDAVTTVSTGTVVVLTATGLEAGSNDKVTRGTVNFCDPSALHCIGQYLFGTAQFTSKGTAIFKFRPGVGTHHYYAQFLGTKTDLASASDIASLTVTGGPFTTTTAIAKSGSTGNYTLTATVSSSDSTAPSPTGTIDFLDTTNDNYLLGSGPLSVGPTTANYGPFFSQYAGYSASSVLIADMNQDGIPDIITTNNANTGASTNFFSILFGQPDGTFQGATSYPNNNGDVPNGIAVGDLNGDGYPDLVIAGLADQLLYVYLNDGHGNLTGPTTYFFNYPGNLAEGPMWPVSGIAIGDLNGDGKADVLLTFPTFSINGPNCSQPGVTGGCAPLGVMLGNGDGSLQFGNTNNPPPWVPVYSSGFVGGGDNLSMPLVLADLRGRGILDAVSTYFNEGQVCVAPGNGDGTFAAPSCYAAGSGAAIAVGDFNGDGIQDIVSVDGGSQGVDVLIGNPDGTYQAAVTYQSSNGPFFPNGVAVADMNGDGKLDIVTSTATLLQNSNSTSNGTVTVQLGNGDGTFGPANAYTATKSGDTLASIAVADLNGDGVLDAVGSDYSSWAANWLFGSLTTSATATLSGVSPVGASTTTHAVEASYGGDTNYTGSTSTTTALTAKPVSTTLGLASNLAQIAVGGQLTLTATISPDSAQNYAPSGTVTFYMNGNKIGTAAVASNGIATLKPSPAVVQTDTFTASYAGDSNFVASSTSSAVTVIVQKATTTLTLGVCNYSTTWVCPATTSSYGQVIELQITLAPYSVTGGGSSDGETVTFYNNGTVIGSRTLLDGYATMDIAQPAAGSYSFTASYGGDADFIASTTASPSSMTVQKVTPSMSLGVSPVSTNTYGQPVYLTATFNTYPYNVSGETVTFYNGANVVGTATFGSQSAPAMLTLNNLPVGNYNFTAKYSGDGNYLSTTTSASALTVQPLPTTLMVSAPSSITFGYGTPVTVQVFLEPYNLQGGNTTNGEPVTLYQNGTSVGVAPVVSGIATFTIPAPPVGANAYTASYAGDTSFGPSIAAAAYVTVAQTSPTMGITTNAVNGLSGTGQPVTLTATMSSNLATGTVIFYENGNDIGNGTLANGVATFIVNNLPEGNYTFGATYSGDANFTTSTASPTASLTVVQSTNLTLTVNPAHYAAPNQPVTITVTLSPSSIAGHNTDGEMVYIYNGASQFGNATLSNGVGTYTPTNGLPEGTYSFTAVYDSDGILANATTATPVPFAVVTGQLFVVNTSADDAGAAANCTPQSSTTSNSTDSACSLRDALLAAAAAPEGASISFATSAFTAPTTIELTNGGLTLPANTTLTGPTLNSGGANVTNLVTVDGNGTSIYQTSSTVFTVTGPGTAISNLTISGGWPNSYSDDMTNGGGILNSGTLTLTNSTIMNNGTFNNGGGIYNTGTLTVIGSTFSNNTAAADGFGDGGGIDSASGTLTVINSTFANNFVRGGYGGGIGVDGGTATITQSTLTGNTVGGGGGGLSTIHLESDGSTVVPGGTVTLANTIVSGNNDFFSDIDDDGVAYTDQGGNIVGYINRTFTPVNDPTTLNLGPLDNYGGPTQTILPLPGSQVICAGSYLVSPSQWNPPLVAINIDQRGYPNYNLAYGQLPRTPPASNPLPAACFDSGAVQTNYTAVQFPQTTYTGLAGGAVTPIVTATVTENGISRQAVPVALSYSGPGNLSNNSATTATGTGAVFTGLSVDTAGNGTLSTQIVIAGTSYISGSANLTILPAPQITPASESISAASGASLVQVFSVSGGSGAFQLTSTGTLPTGLTLTPPAAGTGSSWTLSGTPTQLGTYNFTLSATDVTNSIVTVSQSYALTVAPSTTTTLVASPASSAPVGQTITLTATVSSPSANGTVSFFDGGNLLGPGAVSLSTGSPNTATLALNASTLGAPVSFGPHSFTAQFSGDATDAASTSNTVPYNVVAPNLVVNTIADDSGSFTCTSLASTTSNTTDGNNGGTLGECTLRDALNTASGLGAASIYFDTTVFAASNLTANPAANAIAVNVPAYSSLSIPSNTTIQGFTSGSGATLTNLVTVDGGGSSVENNGTIFVVNGTSTAINNLNINNGYASNGFSGGAIANNGSIAISGSAFTGNQATGSGGGIYNGGPLTVVNSTFYNNSATGGNGGAIDNTCSSGCGTATVSNSTFYQNSALNGGNGYGGAMNNVGNGPIMLTVNNSTIVGNFTDNSNPSNGYGGGGGGINSNNSLYLTNNVITGNTISGSSADDLDDNFSVSNYTTGSTYTTQNNMINGNLVGIWNGLTENGTSVTMAPLANYGGPTQTMIPLPGSVAICAGIAGGTTDQRGDPLQPVGGYCPAGTVDSGAAQTNYALAFTTEPPANAYIEVALAPAPVLTLTESGNVFAPATGTVTITDLDGALDPSGTNSAALSSGTAAFSNLLFSSVAASDTLTASLSLNPNLSPALNLIALPPSTPINVVSPYIPATMISPTPGTVLGAGNVVFQWAAGGDVALYQLSISTVSPGLSEVYLFKGTATSALVPNLPANGLTVYARLYSKLNGAWQYNDYVYTESGSPVLAALTSPTPGLTTVLGTSNVGFQWTTGTGASVYQLNLSAVAPGASDLFSYKGTATSATATTLPANGVTVYARLYSKIDGAWQYNDYVYTEGGTPLAVLTSPTPGLGTVLGSSDVAFNWTTGAGVSVYQLNLGTTAPGASDLFVYKGSATSANVTTLPANGVTVYARLYSKLNGAWQYNDYVYTESGSPAPAVLQSPTPGLSTVLGTSSVQFQWSTGTGVSDYQLNLSAVAPGASDLYLYKGTATSATATTLPANGVTVYARLYSKIDGVWQYNDYVYTEQ